MLLKIQNTKFRRIHHLRVMSFHAQAELTKLVVAYETALQMLVMVMMMMMIAVIIFQDFYLGNYMQLSSSKSSVIYITRKTNLLLFIMFCITPV